MPTVPGTSVLAGATTVILLPDGSNIPWSSVTKYFIDVATSVATVRFNLNDGTNITYDFVTEQLAGLAMKALQSIPNNPSSFYILTQLFPLFAALNLNTITGPAAGGTPVVLSGIGFVDGCLVDWGGTLADTVVFTNSTSLTVTTLPGAVSQIVYPEVINPDGTRSTTLNSFIYS